MSSRTWPHRSMRPPLRTFSGRTANTSTTGQTSTWWRASCPAVCSQEADRAVASRTTLWWARCPRSGVMPAALGAGQTQLCSVTLRSWAEQVSGSSKERTVSSSPTQFRRRPFSGSSARTTSAGPTRRSLPRSARTACCTLCETFGLRPLRPRPQPWTIPRLLPAARMSQALRPLARARVPMKQTLRSPARAVICRTRRPLRPPRPDPYHWGPR